MSNVNVNDQPFLVVQVGLSGQDIGSEEETPVAFERVSRDTNTDWDEKTMKYTPALPGWYLFCGEIVAASCKTIEACLYKDNVQGPIAQSLGSGDDLRSCNFAFAVEANGSQAFDLRAKVSDMIGGEVSLSQTTRMVVTFLRGP